MGFWDYKCESCGHEFEENYPIADQDKPTTEPCPICGESAIIRPFQAPIINLSYRKSSIQSDPKIRKFQEEVLKPIKKGLGKSGRVRSIE
jgi:putative FmdB family regulatory protein